MALKPCCCISSKTGAIILGTLGIIISVLGIVYVLFSYAGMSSIQSLQDPVLKEQLMQEIRKAFKANPEYEHLNDEAIFYMMFTYLSFVMVVCIVELVMSSILVHGVRKEHPRLLQIYLIYSAILFCLALVSTIFSAIMNMNMWMVYIWVTSISYVVYFYCVAVIYSAYVEVRNNVLQRQNPAVKYEA
ncbi:unnamed protein product [Orchesella dallaii]|uniref:Uncharacterized protein n=1 Tax=Orchesella dallaii TaxID=48710 RepID=A0ABP1R807_9HEXA